MPTKKEKILIIEDEGALARALSLKLNSSGYETDIANDGQEGLDKIKKNGYKLVLLDLVMPNKDGFDVLTELQKNSNKINNNI